MSKAEKPYDLHGEIAAWREGSMVWRALVAPRVALFADELMAALEAAEARVAELEAEAASGTPTHLKGDPRGQATPSG